MITVVSILVDENLAPMVYRIARVTSNLKGQVQFLLGVLLY